MQVRALLGRARPRQVVDARVLAALCAVERDADPVQQAVDLEAREHDADRAGQATRIGDDLVRGHRHVVAAGRGRVAQARDHGLLLGDPSHGAPQEVRRERLAARAVDAQHDRAHRGTFAQRAQHADEATRLTGARADRAEQRHDGDLGNTSEERLPDEATPRDAQIARERDQARLARLGAALGRAVLLERCELARQLVAVDEPVDDARGRGLRREVGTRVDPRARARGTARAARLESRDQRLVQIVDDGLERLARGVRERVALEHLTRGLVGTRGVDVRAHAQAIEHPAQEHALGAHTQELEPALGREPETVGESTEPRARVPRRRRPHDHALARAAQPRERTRERRGAREAELPVAEPHDDAAHLWIFRGARQADVEIEQRLRRPLAPHERGQRRRGFRDAVLERERDPVAGHAQRERQRHRVAQPDAGVAREPQQRGGRARGHQRIFRRFRDR